MLNLPYAVLLAGLALATSNSEPTHLKLDFDVLKGNSRLSAQKGAQASVVSRGNNLLELTNQWNYYSCDIKVGSRGDVNTVLVDTGSSDLWVMASDVACYEQPNTKRSLEASTPAAHHQVFGFQYAPVAPAKEPTFKKRDNVNSTSTATTSSQTLTRIDAATCTSLGSFNTELSDTYHANSSAPPFSILYGGGTFADGVWGTDSISVGPFDVSEISLAVVNDTTNQFGIFGIGLSALEVTYSDAYPQFAYKYQNFPVRLKDTGVIGKVAYSLYLNDVAASTGSVLFGAVDHAKYTGQLQTVPIVNVYPQYFSKPISFNVVLDSITVGDDTQNITVTTDSLAALLDSGTTLTYLPQPIVDSLAASLNGQQSQYGFYEVDCSYNTSSAFATYNFSGIDIRVPVSDLIMNPIVAGTNDSKCYLGLVNSPPDQSTGAPTCILGDNFLRHAYIVYDLEEYEISLAQVKYTDSENLEVITGAIPSAVRAPGYSNTALASVIGAQPSHGYLTLPTTSSAYSSSYTTEVSSGESSVSAIASSTLVYSSASSSVSSSASSGVSSGSIPSAVSYSAATSAVAIYPISSAASVQISSNVLSSAVAWNTSNVSASSSASSTGSSLSGSLTTATNVAVSTSVNAAGSTVLVTYTYTTTYCPETSVALSSSSLTTATNVVVSTSTDAAGSTVLVTNTYTTTYCPASSASSASAASAASAASVASVVSQALSSLTTATNTVVSTSTDAAGSTVLVTYTYTTTYCPASASASAPVSAPVSSSSTDTTIYVTLIETIDKHSSKSTPAVTGGPAGFTTTLVSVNSAASTASSFSSSPAAQTSSVSILQGSASAMSILSTMLLVPILALI